MPKAEKPETITTKRQREAFMRVAGLDPSKLSPNVYRAAARRVETFAELLRIYIGRELKAASK